MRGYLHSMKHHRAANLIDYVFRVSQLYSTLLYSTVFSLLCSIVCTCKRKRFMFFDMSMLSRLFG